MTFTLKYQEYIVAALDVAPFSTMISRMDLRGQTTIDGLSWNICMGKGEEKNYVVWEYLEYFYITLLFDYTFQITLFPVYIWYINQ